jgi:hypothetical protein
MKDKENKRVKIKVIKKNEVRQVEKPAVSKEEEKESNRREIVSTVSDWVNELRHRRTDSSVAIDTFFSRVPQKA